MNALLRLLLDISLLRAGPQQLPASRFLLLLAFVAHWATGTLHGGFSLPFAEAAFSAILSTLTALALIHGLLVIRGFPARTLQASSGLLGCESLLGLVAVPAILSLQFGSEPAIPALLILVLIGWNLAIAAHVFRHALDISFHAGLLLSLGYLTVSYVVVGFAAPAGV